MLIDSSGQQMGRARLAGEIVNLQIPRLSISGSSGGEDEPGQEEVDLWTTETIASVAVPSGGALVVKWRHKERGEPRMEI